MPKIWQVDLSDGRTVDVESDTEPNEDELLSSLSSWQESKAQPESDAPSLEPPSGVPVTPESIAQSERNFPQSQPMSPWGDIRGQPDTGFTEALYSQLPRDISHGFEKVMKPIEKVASDTLNLLAEMGVNAAAGPGNDFVPQPLERPLAEPGRSIIPGLEPSPEAMGIIPSLRRAGAGMTTPGMLATLPIAAESKLVQGAFLAGAGASVPQAVQAVTEAKTPAETRGALTDLALSLGMTGLIGHGMAREKLPAKAQPDTQLQPSVPREGIAAEVAKPVEEAKPVTAEAPPQDVTLKSVLDMSPEQYFDTSGKWSAEAMSEKGGINPQVRAELAAQANPDLKAWQEAQAKASADFSEIKKEVSANPELMGDPLFQKRFAGAAQRASFFSEGRAILDGSKQPNAKTVELSVAPKEKAPLDDLTVAIRVKGKPITGDASHMDIALKGGDADIIESASKPENQGFVYKGEFISREKAAELIGEKRPLTSERLAELRAKVIKPAEPTSVKPDMASAQKPGETGTPAGEVPITANPVVGDKTPSEAPGIREVADWTSATEDIAEVVPEPGRTVPTNPNIVEMGAGIPIPKFADRKMAPLDKVTTSHSGKLQKSFSEARLAQNEIKKAVPSDRRQSAISIWREANGDIPTLQAWAAAAKGKLFKQAATEAQSLTAKEIAIANKAIAALTALESRGNTFDVLKSHRENYVPHVWDVKRPGTGFGTGMLKERFRFSKARTFNTFFEGDQAGFKPKTLAIGKLLPAYLHEMNKVISDRQMVRDLAKGTMPDGSPMVSPRGNSKVVDGPGGKAVLVSPKAMREADVSDYKTMSDQPALSDWTWEGKDTDGKPVFVKADLALHPDVYRRVNATIGQSALRSWYHDPVSGPAQIPRAIMRGLDTAQSAMKREMFGLLAPFHQVQEGTHAIGHLVNPFFGLEKVDLVKNPKQVDAANHGLMLLPDRASTRVYLEGVGTQSSFLSQGLRKSGKATAGVGEAIADVIDGYQDYLFHQYIPSLKFKTYEAMVGRNTKLYAKELASGEMTPADVKLTSSEQANAAYGHLNYALLDRNPTMQHMIQLAALAPDFLEARVRFAGQGVKGLRSKVGHEQFKAIAILAAAQAGTAFVLSQLLGVPWDEEHPFEVVYGGRRYAMRSVPEDIFGLMKDTRQFVYSRVNPLTVKGGVQLATGLNYRGEKVTPTETMTELLAGYIPITARAIPAIRSLTETGKKSPVTPLQQLAGSLGLRISRYSPISETYNLAGEWMDKQKISRDRGSYPVSKYQQLRYALEDGDLERAKTEYETLKKDTPAKKIREGFKQSINHPFTGSEADDKKFAKTLTGYDKELYEQALRSRKNILKAFKSL